MTTNKHKDIGIDIPDTPQPIPDIDPLAQATNLEYAEVWQNKYSNSLATINYKKAKKQAEIENQLRDFLKIDIKDLVVTFDKSKVKAISANDTLILDSIMIEYAKMSNKDKLKNPLIEMSVMHFMALRGIDEPKTARNQLDHFYNVYYNASVELKGAKKGVDGAFRIVTLRVRDRKAGIYKFQLDQNYVRLMERGGKLFYPTDLFKIDTKIHPQAVFIARKIYLNKRTNKKSAQADRISVKSLLASTTLPTFEDEQKGARHQKQNIIQPFLKELLHLEQREYFKVDVLSNGDTYRIADFANMRELGWSEFYNSMIVIRDWNNFPEDELTKLDHQKADHVKNQAKAKAKAKIKRTTNKTR